MSARRILEVTNGVYRLRARTPWLGEATGSTVMEIELEDVPNGLRLCMDLIAGHVEELHQFTFEILAGRHSDPRLTRDAEIMCGAQEKSDGHLECALPEGHRRVGNWEHVTRDGIVFDVVPF
jgi:hypothetical protein